MRARICPRNRAVEALNGRLRFNPDSGQLLYGGAVVAEIHELETVASTGRGTERSLSSKERGLEWQKRNQQVCVCVHARARACVRACEHACVRACMRASVLCM